MCIIKGFRPKFIISVLYINDMNIIETPGELENITSLLKEIFEMKDFGKTKFCLNFEIEHTIKWGFVYQSIYFRTSSYKVYIDNLHALTNLMVVRHLEAENEQFRHYKKYEKPFGPEVPYLNVIGAVTYIVSNTIKT